MSLNKISIFGLFGFWFISSIFADSVSKVESYYVYIDYIFFLIVCIECLCRAKQLKLTYYSLFIILLFSITLSANLDHPYVIIFTHLKFLIYAFLISINNQGKSYARVWKYKWILLPVLFLYMIGWNKLTRPFILYENNFELLALIILFTPGIIFKFDKWKIVLITLGMIVFRSGSLSVLLCYFSLLFFISNGRVKILLFSAAIPSVLFFISMKGVTDFFEIDRVIFANIALETFENRSLLKMFLSFSIEEILPKWNNYLNYYNLDYMGVNYPVSLHAFHLRIILIYGIFGFFVVNFLLYKSIIHDIKIKRILFTILLISGLSISSYNNMFAFIGLYFITKYNSMTLMNLKHRKFLI